MSFLLRSTARTAFARRSPLALQARFNSTQPQGNFTIFSSANFTKFFPKLKITGDTTLGEIWEAGYVKYRYRLVYPIILWATFLWWNLWIPYTPESEKKKMMAHDNYLQSLEWKQRD
ncbi:hypothetical protein HK104_004293 [Borealophlyctis nickersoniae]|nr:hypothetical protein HK104_004293 [Borealophlyctis nickersoniae]